MNKKILTAAIGAAMIVGPLAAQAELKISGSVAGSLASVDGIIGFQDMGRTRLQFDIKTDSGFFARTAVDMRASKYGTGKDGMPPRDQYVGLKADFGSLSFGRIAGAVKNLEGDPFIASFLELRNNAVSGGGFGSSSFNNNIVQYASKFGDASVKVQYDPTSSTITTGTPGHMGLGVKAKMAGANVFLGYNNKTNTGTSFTKLGGSMKFGDIKGKVYYEDNATVARFVLGAEMKMAGGMVDVSYGDKGSLSSAAYYRVGYMKKASKKSRWWVGYVQNGNSSGDVATFGAGARVDL